MNGRGQPFPINSRAVGGGSGGKVQSIIICGAVKAEVEIAARHHEDARERTAAIAIRVDPGSHSGLSGVRGSERRVVGAAREIKRV